jgi:hypothetical protein
MSISSQLQPLLLQFQSRYPLGGLCSELLTIHQNQYVVRAFVQVGNVTLATAMAAAPELEAAEDGAKLRVLAGLGFTSANQTPVQAPAQTPVQTPIAATITSGAEAAGSTISVVPSTLDRFNRLNSLNTANANKQSSHMGEPAASSPELEPAPPITQISAAQVVAQVGESRVAPVTETASPASFTAEASAHDWGDPAADQFKADQFKADQFKSASQQGLESDLAEAELADSLKSAVSESPIEPLVENPVPVEAGVAPVRQSESKPAKASKRKAEATAPAAPPTAPAATSSIAPPAVDHSQEIMRIGIEMKRLGWSTEQGREYLKRTYGKRSRQELDDAELLDFLHYLEAQSSPLQTPF